MIRSEINRAIDTAIAFFADQRFALPPYAHFTPADWAAAGPEYDEIRALGLGWDVTDFGSGDLARVGRTLFTLRNGSTRDSRYAKSYAQKLMCMPPGQQSITHYHRQKTEDLHNQGGGDIDITLWRAAAAGGLSDEAFTVSVSGVSRQIAAGTTVTLHPGEWICVRPLTYHRFGAAPGGGHVFGVEVSSVCDDHHDNFFLGDAGQRFPPIVEDEPRRHVLCQEYPAARS